MQPVQKVDVVKKPMGTWKRAGLGLVALTTVSVAGIGFLHTSTGRPLLLKMSGCPLGQADPKAVQAGAEQVVARDRGAESAPSRPALGFALDRTTLADVERWAHEHDLACEAAREDTLYQCKLVPTSALPNVGGMEGRVDDLTFAFREDGTLWTVSAWSFKLPAGEATSRLLGVSRSMEHAVGKPDLTYGELAAVGSAPGVGAGAKYKYQDYVANLNASTSDEGVSVQQQYSSVRPAPAGRTVN